MKLALHGQAPNQVAQGGQDSGGQLGLAKLHHEENLHRDVPQSIRFDTST